MEGATAMTLAELLTALLSVVTQIFGTGIGTVGTSILSNVLFQLVAGIAVGGILVRVFKSMIHAL